MLILADTDLMPEIDENMKQHPPWFDARLPDAAECSVGNLLQQRVEKDPDRPFLVLENAEQWSNQLSLNKFRDTAAIIAGLRLTSGDRLILMLPNGPDLLRYLFAAWMLGIIPAPVNPALHGKSLATVLELADSSVIVTQPNLASNLIDIGVTGLRTVVLTGEPTSNIIGLSQRVLQESEATPKPGTPDPVLNQPWDTAAIVFSSGTTGVPKGVQVTFAQLWSLGTAFYGYVRDDDRMLLQLPLFHILTLGALFGSVTAGATLAIIESFRASTFLETIYRVGATTIPGLGRSFIDVINKTPLSARDADCPLRCMIVQCSTPAVKSFAKRFHCDVLACYNMTETSCITISELNPEKIGSMGTPRTGIAVRIVDEHDRDVPEGEPGEIVVRAELPWVLNDGYVGNPGATVQAWRNGWFHTGDIGRRDKDGDIFFIDRSGDVIRRRGENISSVEIESEVRQHQGVGDAAALGVDTPGGEEILIVVTPLGDAALDPEELFHFLEPRLPHFMLPYFIRIVDELPKTSIGKVQKSHLGEEGAIKDCWDRVTAGLTVKRGKPT